jgi:hypothetical protein
MASARTAALFVVALGFGTTGCPLLVEDDFVFVLPADGTPAGRSGSAGAPASAGDTATGGTAASAGNTAAGGAPIEPSGGTGGTADPPPECVPCADGERCQADADCLSGRCSSAGTCRACGLRLTSVQTACPASCTRCDAGTCYIECASNAACKEAVLICPPNMACQVACTGESACEKSSVACPAEFPCDLVCTGKQACKGTTAACGSGPCVLNCAAEAACKDATLRCGDDLCEAKCSAGAETPQIDCGESCDCATCNG